MRVRLGAVPTGAPQNEIHGPRALLFHAHSFRLLVELVGADRDLTVVVADKKYLIRDRDPLFTEKLDSIFKAAGAQPVKLPPRSPNLNSHAERFVRSVREEGLDHLILSSEDQLRYVLAEYLQYYHHERIHQGLGRIIEPQHEGNQGEIICIERLGGLLKSYHRKAA
jgi:hypothetical protein